jgi:pyrroline-5-carboxylate reductase
MQHPAPLPTHNTLDTSNPMKNLVFIGGGNMASAIISGLIQGGHDPALVHVVEPQPAQRERLQTQWGVCTGAKATESLRQAELVVWAVKPQLFQSAAAPCASWLQNALHLSVMAGLRSTTLAHTLGTERLVRAMPNTPALIGQGMAGLYAGTAVTATERAQVEAVLAPTGQVLWVTHEEQLDTVTAISGSGPAYVFYVVEALLQAGRDMGLPEHQAKQLALATFSGATALAQASEESLHVLRERVTSPGGTTHAAVNVLQQHHVKEAFVAAAQAAQARARELGDEFSKL